MGDAILLLASFAVILAGALIFTNAVEWAGHRLALGQGAVGSILAAVGTAMPETLIPIVAIIEGDPGSEGVAIGAIVGAPFLLATIAMLLVGLSALAYARRRPQGRDLNAHGPTLERDLGFFLPLFAAGLLLGLGTPEGLRVPAAVAFVLAYLVYVRLTLRRGGEAESAEEIGPLILARASPGGDPAGPPAWSPILVQLVVGLGAIVGGAHLFVEELVSVAESIGVEALVLSLILAPLATELPEKANSFFWIRDGKDSLALGNITGAMVFQSTVPVAVGLAFTDWDLNRFAITSMALGLAGGAIAYLALHRARRFTAPPIVAWGLLYAAFLAFVLAAA
jgi:cation:H+ antiporter